MASFDFLVDTNPMAQTIDGVNHKVGIVGGAVTAMQAAVIASEKAASDRVCSSIDNGFYMLMRSRFSQRLAQFQSNMSSRVGSMTETGAAIDRTHQQMLGDFNRIKSRYMKLFDSLDRNLEERVAELDRPAMVLSQKRKSLLVDSQCRQAPAALFYSEELGNVALKAQSATIKSRALGSIDSLGHGAESMIAYERETAFAMEDGTSRGAAVEHVPVVYSVGESLAAPNEFFINVSAPSALPSDSQTAIARRVRAEGNALASSSSGDVAAIRTSFVEKLAQNRVDDRVSQVMLWLFDSSFYGAAATAPSDQRPTPGTQTPQPDPTGEGGVS